MAELASVNQLSPTESVVGIEALVVPVPPVAEPLTRTRLYTVRRGDTLVTIADRLGVSLSQLRRWNGIPSGTRVDPGRRLHVAEPAPVRASTTHRRRTSAAGARAGTATHPTSSASKPRQVPTTSKTRGSTRDQTHPQAARKTTGAKSGAAHKPAGSARPSPQQ
jgi:membrane-bound lytic murein transglycosylase D